MIKGDFKLLFHFSWYGKNRPADVETGPQLFITSYLYTSCHIKDGKIVTDLYRKLECLDSIPFSLSMRINRICSEEGTRDLRLEEIKEMLLDLQYTPKVIDSAIARAKAIPRQQALRRVPGPQPITKRSVFNR